MPTTWGAGSLSESDFRHIYQLMAVVVHTGDAHSGHFITYRKGHQNTKWVKTILQNNEINQKQNVEASMQNASVQRSLFVYLTNKNFVAFESNTRISIHVS